MPFFKRGDLVRFDPNSCWIREKCVKAWFFEPTQQYLDTQVMVNDVFEVLGINLNVLTVWNVQRNLKAMFCVTDFIHYNQQ